ncbi:MAG: PDZ domain-containing protein [Candidatus Latescibacterota bacterium]|nr:MAG: PDZ domain-containing protein [Candidatus Latescibacterota bacterium]
MDGAKQPRRGLLHIVLIGLFPVVLLYAFLGSLGLEHSPDFGMRLRLFEVATIRPGGPAERAGFRIGDRIDAVNGIPRDDMVRLLRDHGTMRPGSTVLFSVRRGDERLELTATASEKPRRDKLRALAQLAVGVCFLVVGLVVYRNRTDLVARLFYLVGALFAVILIEPPATGDVRLQAAIKIARDASIVFLPALFLHFVLLFPHEKKVPRWLFLLRPFSVGGRGLLRFPLYAVSLLLFGGTAFLTIRIFATGRANPVTLSLFQFLAACYLFACFVAGVAAFVHSYAETEDPGMRRKLRGVLLGTTAALLPIGIYALVRQFQPEWESSWEPVLTLLLILLPVSFGHAIVRYRLLDFELILKRGILYGLLTAVLATIYLVFVDLVSRLLRSLVGGSDIPATLLSLFLIALLFSPVRETIQRWVDRTFYREKYEHRKTLHEFSAALTTILDRETLLRHLVERISETLHISKVAVFLRDPKESALVLRAGTGIGDGTTGSVRFGPSEALPGLLRGQSGALPFERIAGPGASLLPKPERERLASLGAALLLPLVAGEEVVGMISLGPKRSGELYSHEDRQLLKTLANNAALAIENSELHHNTIEKERMERELRLAREIQLGFLPRKPPEIPAVDLAAVNAPCREIGGDYYDFLPTRPAGLGVAVADATGHGVPAALLMANLQATLRVEALTHTSPAEVLGRVNAFAFRQAQESHFVTCFYGLVDVRTGCLRYANAGHNPPLLVRADGTSLLLGDSDILLGVDEGSDYREHAVDLFPGDVLVLYTDGVTEEPNAREESFGIERLTDLVRANRGLSAVGICDLVLRNVMEFVAGEPGDDITLVVLRYR